MQAWFVRTIIPSTKLWTTKFNVMAEIHVETKKNQSTPAWVWILVTVAIVALAAYFLTRSNTTTTDQNTGTNKSPSSYVQPEINAVYKLQAA